VRAPLLGAVLSLLMSSSSLSIVAVAPMQHVDWFICSHVAVTLCSSTRDVWRLRVRPHPLGPERSQPLRVLQLPPQVGYVASWSAYVQCRAAHPNEPDPLPAFAQRLREGLAADRDQAAHGIDADGAAAAAVPHSGASSLKSPPDQQQGAQPAAPASFTRVTPFTVLLGWGPRKDGPVASAASQS
jgi:hypothetical protein